MNSAVKTIVISGPTGSGKSALARKIAPILGGEIVNYDSVQIYRGFDIGSAKPTVEQRSVVPHHLYDIAAPADQYDAVRLAQLARVVLEEISARSRVAILVGGTGFYLQAILHGLPALPGKDLEIRQRLETIRSRSRGQMWLLSWIRKVDPEVATKIGPGDWHRLQRAIEVYLISGQKMSRTPRPRRSSTPDTGVFKLAIHVPRTLLLEIINRRVEEMYQGGLIEETAGLLETHGSKPTPFKSIGYREAIRHLQGEINLETAKDETKRRTRQYAKRQMTWLRGEGGVHWVDYAPLATMARQAMEELRIENEKLD